MKPRDKALFSGLGRLGDVDLRLLRVFKAVADCGGMAAAELELNIAMSTISRHVKDLEQRLGLVLCRRGRAGFALTPEGESVHAAIGALLSATDAFRAQVHDLHRQMGGELHLALFEKILSNGEARVAEALGRFRAQAPAVSLHLHVGTIAMIERGVVDGRFHLAIAPEHRRSEQLRYDALFGETMQLYAARGHPWFARPDRLCTWQALRGEALAGLDYHSPNLQATHAHRLERQAHASDQEAVGLLILSGAFVGFLPDHYAQPLVAAGRVRAVAPKTLRYRARFACVRRHAPAPPRVAEAFRQCLLTAHAA